MFCPAAQDCLLLAVIIIITVIDDVIVMCLAASLTLAPGTVAIVTSDGRMIVVSVCFYLFIVKTCKQRSRSSGKS